jgi:predicted nucleotidyltransferase
LNSVVIKSIDRKQIRNAVETYILELRSRHPEIVRVIWFGSWVSGLPSPGSDVDLCLIVSASDKIPRDRVSDYLPLGFPVGVDLVVYAQDEFERLRKSSPGWYAAITSGIEL